jgi:ATP synthase F1 epsilon subunit
MKMQLCVMTPEAIVSNQEVDEVILPTTTGQIGILPNHAPLITGLDIGVLTTRTGTNQSRLVVTGGFGLVKEKNQLTVLVNQAELFDSENPKFAADTLEANFQDTKKAYESAEGQKEKMETLLAFKRAKAFYSAANPSN